MPLGREDGHSYDAGHAKREFRRTTGLAIEMLTALYDDPDSKRFYAERIAQLKDEDLPDLCVGLLDVAVLVPGDLSDERAPRRRSGSRT